MAEDVMSDLRKAVKTPKIVLGARRSLIEMKKNGLAVIYVASNAPEMIKQDIAHYAKFAPVRVELLDIASDELGIVCKRQHTVSVAAVRK